MLEVNNQKDLVRDMWHEGLFLLSHFKGNHPANLFTCWLRYKINQTVAFNHF